MALVLLLVFHMFFLVSMWVPSHLAKTKLPISVKVCECQFGHSRVYSYTVPSIPWMGSESTMTLGNAITADE